MYCILFLSVRYDKRQKYGEGEEKKWGKEKNIRKGGIAISANHFLLKKLKKS